MKTKLLTLVSLAAFACSAAVIAPFSPKTGETFTTSVGGKLTAIEAFAPTNGTIVLKSIYSADVNTNAVSSTTVTNFDWTVVTSNRTSHVVATNTWSNLAWSLRDDVIGVTTNAHPKTTTRSWPVFKETVAVTNDVVSGSATSYLYKATLATPQYVAPGERFIYTGTASGGWIRLIFE